MGVPEWSDKEPRTIGGMPVPSLEEIESAKINTDLEKADPDDTPTRAAAAVALRISGASWTQIAQALDYSSAFRARQVVERAIAESAESTEEHSQLRWLEARRLERILQSLWRKATDDASPDHLPYARTALAVIDRHARLHGLDAPQQMVVYTPDQEEVDRWVKGMASQVRSASTAREADVIDVEWEDADGQPPA